MKFLILLLMTVFAASGNANAALKSSKNTGEVNPAAAYNPKSDKADMELPMPNNLKMVLRAVAVPATGPLNDTKFSMGMVNPVPERSIYEKKIDRYIAAPFKQENLPAAWKNNLDKSDAGDFMYYFLGKYELTNGQWDAIMEGESSGPAELPKTNISWYDLQEFLQKYNEWLLANHPDQIPAIDGVPAFLRLPTEAEWEFAAKGGSQVPNSEQENKDIVEENIDDYAVFGPRYENVRPIGSKKANNLGFYDLAGNAAELVGDGFRFTVSEQGDGSSRHPRLHGSEGGLISKGGSFLAKEETDVYPGRRVESRMFVKNKDGVFVPLRDRALGTRLALSSLNVPSSKREQDIRKQEEKGLENGAQKPVKAAPAPAAGEKVVIDTHGDPLQELDKIYVVVTSPDMKANLDQYRVLIEDVNEAYSRERDNNLLNSLRSVAYMSDSLANIAYRCYELTNRLRMVRGEKDFPKELEKKVNDEISEQFKNLKRSTNIYRSNAKDLTKFSKKDLDSKIAQLSKQYEGNERLNVRFREKLKLLSEHIDIINKKGIGALTDVNIWEQVIPSPPLLAVLKDLQKSQNRKKSGQKK